MAKQTKTPLEEMFQKLPRFIEFDKNIKPELDKAGISYRTFHRDRKADPSTIPTGRLKVYAQLFNCSIDDLLNGYSKVKSLVNNSIVTKSGLKV